MLARVDFAWPEERLAVEYEGAYHFDGIQIVRDDVRIAALEAAGWRVIRISAADLRDLEALVEKVRAALLLRPAGRHKDAVGKARRTQLAGQASSGSRTTWTAASSADAAAPSTPSSSAHSSFSESP